MIKYLSILVSILTIPLIGNAQVDLKIGLAASYPFSGNANDASNNNRNGTVTGARLTTDRFGNINAAYFFNGVSDYINFGNHDWASDKFTISLFAKMSNQGKQIINGLEAKGGFIFSKGNDYNNYGQGNSFRFYFDPYQYGLNADSWNPSNSRVVSNLQTFNDTLNWHHFVIRYNGTKQDLFIDNLLISSEDQSTPLLQNSYPFLVGTRTTYGNYTNFFKGSIDDINIYNRALNDLELQKLGENCDYSKKPVIELVNNQLTTTSICGATYQWFLNNNTITGASANTHINTLQTGTYKVQLTMSNCHFMSDEFYIGATPCVSPVENVVTVTAYKIVFVDDNEKEIIPTNLDFKNADYIVYPNPSNGIFIIESKKLKVDFVMVYNTEGKVVFEGKGKNVNLTNLHTGKYTLKITDSTNNVSETHNFLIE